MSATAVGEVIEGTVHAVVNIAAPPERVFRALTQPGELAAWWGSPELYQTFDWSVDLRPGGKWSCSARTTADQKLATVGGEYRAIEPPHLLEFTWLASWEEFRPSVVRIEIQATSGGARVVVVHRGQFANAEARDGIDDGWKRVLGWMADHLAREVSR